MKRHIDFTDTPPQRWRRREQAFYCLLAAGALAAALPVIALGWQLQGHTSTLQAAGALLEQELRTLQTVLDDATRLEQDIATLERQLQAYDALAVQRSGAAALLDTLARAGASGVPQVQLVHLGLRQQQAQVRGRAPDQQALQAYIDSLSSTGLAEVKLQELRAANTGAPQRGFVFMLSMRASP